MHKKLLVILIIVTFVVAGLTITGLVRSQSSNNDPAPPAITQPPSDDKPDNKTEYSGKVICLPHKGDGPHTLECALGLKTNNGKNYALKNANITTQPVDSLITVTGTLRSPAASQPYDIVGEIDVTQVRLAN